MLILRLCMRMISTLESGGSLSGKSRQDVKRIFFVKQVHWYQGMFLRPHHMQAADFYQAEQANISHAWDQPYNYGLRRFTYSKDALSNKEFRLTELDARTNQRTLVQLDRPISVDFSHLMDSQSLDVYLTIPELNPGGENVNGDANTGTARFYTEEATWKDQTGWSKDESIEVRKLRLSLEIHPTDHPIPKANETLRLARIYPTSAGSSHPVLDDKYIPPLIAVDAWQYMGQEVIGVLREKIRHKMEYWSERARTIQIGKRVDSNDWASVLFLDRLNSSFTILDLMSQADGVHPFIAYTELSRIISGLSIFADERAAIKILPYQHEDLGGVFDFLRETIINHLDPFQENYLRTNLIGEGDALVATLSPKWFDPKWQWFLGVERPDGLDQESMKGLFAESGNWTLASKYEIDRYFRISAQGVARSLMRERPVYLPPLQDWSYFKLSQDTQQSPAWPDIKKSQTFAVRIGGQNNLQGKHRLDFPMHGKGIVSLQFALFANQK